MATGNFRVTATVPVIVKATDAEIFCNSTKGYRLYRVNKDTRERTLVEEVHMATKRPNVHKRDALLEEWVIEAIK